MKKGIFILGVSVLGIGALLGETVYSVDTQSSVLKWTGRKVTGSHFGTVNLSRGRIILDESGNIKGGEFEIDLDSIKVEDLKDPADNLKLTNHLKDDDFFSVNTHRFAKFVINSATRKGGDKYVLNGDLTIKGISHPISFEAKVKQEDNSFKGFADVKLDRTQWGIQYGSGKFFENLGNRLIYDEFDVQVELVARSETDSPKEQSS